MSKETKITEEELKKIVGGKQKANGPVGFDCPNCGQTIILSPLDIINLNVLTCQSCGFRMDIHKKHSVEGERASQQVEDAINNNQ